MAKSNEEKLAAIKKRKQLAEDKLKDLNVQEEKLKLQVELDQYKKLAPIAKAAVDVFNDELPTDYDGARNFFLGLVQSYQDDYNRNNKSEKNPTYEN